MSLYKNIGTYGYSYQDTCQKSSQLYICHHFPVFLPFPPLYFVFISSTSFYSPLVPSIHKPNHRFETCSAHLFLKSKEACNHILVENAFVYQKKGLLNTKNVKQFAFNDFFVSVFLRDELERSRGGCTPPRNREIRNPCTRKTSLTTGSIVAGRCRLLIFFITPNMLYIHVHRFVATSPRTRS